MSNQPGFFQLQSPLDLLAKMESDYKFRLRDNPINVYAAFDFFVTANHLPEWLGKAVCQPGPAKDEYGRALRAVCKQLANGAKHFNADPDAVVHAAPAGGARYGSDRYSEATYDEGNLIIELAEAEAAALKQPTVSAVMLAGRVLEYWKAHPAVLRCAQQEQEGSQP